MADTPARPVGRRLGNRKDRTGCITCKIRRIKCDEGKPSCQRCSSTGRKCDGYTEPEILTRRSGSPAKLELLPSLGPPRGIASSDEELQALHYFAHVGAFCVAGHTDVGFWSRLIPQTAYVEPAVLHAIMAIGSLLIRANDMSSGHHSNGYSRDVNDARLTFAMEHYSKAIQSTVQSIDQGRGGPTLAAITCVLFFSIEGLQGHEFQALNLFEKARRALNPHLTSTGDDQAVLDEDIRAIFGRMSIQCGMFGGMPADDWRMQCRSGVLAPVAMPISQIESVAQARNELSDLSGLVQHVAVLKWTSGPSLRVSDTSSHLDTRRHLLNMALQHWRRRFDRFRETYSLDTAELGDRIAMSLLAQRHLMVRMWLAGSQDRVEMIYDEYFATFEALTVEAESSLRLLQVASEPTPFTFEMGFIPVLYWAALKCRHGVLRRRALSLLRRAPAQEGLWSRDIMVQVIERAIQLEEGTGEYVGEEHYSHEDGGLPPESRRIKDVRIELRVEVDGKQGDFAQFYTLPYGLDGCWCVTREFFCV